LAVVLESRVSHFSARSRLLAPRLNIAILLGIMAVGVWHAARCAHEALAQRWLGSSQRQVAEPGSSMERIGS